jgi:two-component system NarL family response regulator
MDTIKLLLIEDNQPLRKRIIEFLKPDNEISTVSISGDDNMALPIIQKFNPDIVLLDKGIESQNSLGVVISLKKYFPLTKIYVMDTAPIQSDILLYLKAGASGFIFKDPTLNNFLVNIRTTDKSNVLPPLLVDSLFSQIVNQAVTENKSKIKKATKMTKKEQNVIELLSKGMNNQEIGKRISVSNIEATDLINHIVDKQARIISYKLFTIIKLLDLLRQFPKVIGWSIINLSAKYDLTKNKGINSPRRANSFMILLPNDVTLFFYVSRSNKKLLSMQEFLSKRNNAIKDHVNKNSLIKEPVEFIKENNIPGQLMRKKYKQDSIVK